jgi:hypothetical protein
MLRLLVVCIVVSVLIMAPARVTAQNQDPPLSELLPDLYLEAIIDEYLSFVGTLPEFGFAVDEQALLQSGADRLRVASQIIKLAGNQLSSFPLASASGGFTWNFDTASAAFTRSSNSFGPIFAERPLTIGRKRLNVGANYQRVTFDHLDERELRGGEIVGYFGQELSEGFAIFFADSLDVRVTTDTLNAFATYGITDRLDVGVSIPINRVDLRATLTTRVGTTRTGVSVDDNPVVATRSGTASGVGDVVIRAKYNVLNRRAWAIAESIDVRLPTGDERDLLGVAGPQVKLTFIASSAVGNLSPHVNLAYTISGSSSVADDEDAFVSAPLEEISYAVGADFAPSLRTTIAVDVVGRTLRKAGILTWGPSQFGDQFPQFRLTAGEDLHLLLGSVGVKVNPFANMLLTANVLFPLAKRGLTDRLTWMAGFDYSF